MTARHATGRVTAWLSHAGSGACMCAPTLMPRPLMPRSPSPCIIASFPFECDAATCWFCIMGQHKSGECLSCFQRARAPPGCSNTYSSNTPSQDMLLSQLLASHTCTAKASQCLVQVIRASKACGHTRIRLPSVTTMACTSWVGQFHAIWACSHMRLLSFESKDPKPPLACAVGASVRGCTASGSFPAVPCSPVHFAMQYWQGTNRVMSAHRPGQSFEPGEMVIFCYIESLETGWRAHHVALVGG